MPSLVIVLSLNTAAYGQTVREVPDNYPTAQLAVDAAANGDIIQFNTGVIGDFTVNAKTLNFQGVGSWIGSMTATGGADVTITGMTLYGGTTETDPALISAGIYCQDLTPAAVDAENATVSVIDSTLRCYSTGAIHGLNADVTVTQSVFEYNYFESAINVVGGDLHIEGSTFQYNAGFEGGGVHAAADNTEILTSYFYGNTTSLGGGGGLYVASDVAYVSGNNFLNNYNLLWWIPGLVVDDPSDLLGQDVGGLVVASGDGAGMYVTDPALAPATSVTVHDNTFCGNLGDIGAGLYVDDVEGIQVINNRFADNWSMHLGGGLYVRADSAFIDPAHIQNNTFMKNTAGLFPPPYPPAIVVIGGGGAVALDGTVADFRNNIVAYTDFGGGVMGVDGADYTIGDLVTVDYNILFWNCDAVGCPPDTVEDWAQFTGDMNEYALPATNLPLDPFPVYFGGGEFNCVPDAFYPTWGSPAVRNGDLTLPNKIDPNFSDIGSYGGPQANVLDRDGDLFENIYDCNDEPDQDGASVYPGAPDICDGLDNDCDGVIDEDFITTWYPDADADGYGDVNYGQPIIDCIQPANTTSNRDDCDDNNPAVHPGQNEICNGLDDDCDLAKDGGLPFIPLYQDLDGDGYGAGGQYDGCAAQDDEQGPGHYYVLSADLEPYLVVEGFVENHDDCNDFDLNVNPFVTEVCDGKDNDCNLVVDDSSQDGALYYTDGDHDGYGTPESGAYACDPPSPDSVDKGGDCDDFNPDRSPAAIEVCDTIDNDCDGTTDQDAQNAELKYEDLDGDGYGNPATAARDCNPGPTYTTKVGGDCDDNDPLVGVCNECGCQAVPTPTTAGAMIGALTLLMGLRRRKV